jgi:hypothetical protein
MVTASFNDEAINYREFFKDVQGIVAKYQDGNSHRSHEPMTRGWGYFIPALPRQLHIARHIVLVHYYGIRVSRDGGRPMTGTCSALWGRASRYYRLPADR